MLRNKAEEPGAVSWTDGDKFLTDMEYDLALEPAPSYCHSDDKPVAWLKHGPLRMIWRTRRE